MGTPNVVPALLPDVVYAGAIDFYHAQVVAPTAAGFSITWSESRRIAGWMGRSVRIAPLNTPERFTLAHKILAMV